MAATARRGGLYATHMRNEADGLFASLDESIAAVRAAGSGARLQVSHLKCGSRSVWGRAGEAVARPRGGAGRGARRRRRPVPVHRRRDDAWPRSCRRRSRPSASTRASTPSTDPHVRDLVRAEIERGISGWENVASDPGWERHPHLVRGQPSRVVRPVARRAGRRDPRRPGRPRLRRAGRRPARRLGRHRVHDRARRRDDHGRAVDRGLHRCRGPPPGPSDPRRRPAAPADLREHGAGPRAVRPRARRCSRSRRRSPSSRPSRPARLGLRDRGVVREGAVRRPRRASTRRPSRTRRPTTEPARYPIGIDHVIVNGRPAILDGAETGERPGRLLRRP